MNQWEYISIQTSSTIIQKDPNEFTRQLNAAGWDGWELVTVIHHDHPVLASQSVTAVLKRAVTEERRQQLTAGS